MPEREKQIGLALQKASLERQIQEGILAELRDEMKKEHFPEYSQKHYPDILRGSVALAQYVGDYEESSNGTKMERIKATFGISKKYLQASRLVHETLLSGNCGLQKFRGEKENKILFRVCDDGKTPFSLLLKEMLGDFFPGCSSRELLAILQAAEALHAKHSREEKLDAVLEGNEFLITDTVRNKKNSLMLIRDYEIQAQMLRTPLDPIKGVGKLFRPFVEK